MLSALGATTLPTVPLSAIMRHNTNIIHAEAAVNHTSQYRSRTVVDDNRSYMEVSDARERRLISSSSQHSYVFTPGNTPATGNTPVNTPDHSPAHKSRTRPAPSFEHDNSQHDDLSYTPHLRGGGKSTRKTKTKPKKSPWDNKNLMVEDSSFLYEFENRSKLRVGVYPQIQEYMLTFRRLFWDILISSLKALSMIFLIIVFIVQWRLSATMANADLTTQSLSLKLRVRQLDV
jgi:hypothetical protein